MARSVDDLHTDLDDFSVDLTPVVTLTPEARAVVLEAIAAEPEPEHLALWFEVRGVQDGAFVYDLYFQAVADAADEDAVHSDDTLAVVVPAASVDRLRGARSSGPRRVPADWCS